MNYKPILNKIFKSKNMPNLILYGYYSIDKPKKGSYDSYQIHWDKIIIEKKRYWQNNKLLFQINNIKLDQKEIKKQSILNLLRMHQEKFLFH